jgi:hypothetical protein
MYLPNAEYLQMQGLIISEDIGIYVTKISYIKILKGIDKVSKNKVTYKVLINMIFYQ